MGMYFVATVLFLIHDLKLTTGLMN